MADGPDIAVAGAGVVGAAAALAAAGRGFRVALIEPRAPLAQPGNLGVELRNLALNPAARHLLEELGAWQDVLFGVYREMQVWEEQGTARLRFTAEEVGREALGWIVEQGSLAESLWRRAAACPGIVLHEGSGVTQVSLTRDAVHLETAAASLSARLLLVADGARSPTRALLGVDVTTWPTGHDAIATVVRTERPHAGIARQNFQLDGPLALLPSRFPDLVSVVWSQRAEMAERRMALADTAFCDALARASDQVLGAVRAVDQRVRLTISQQLVRDFQPASRVLLLGDAARVVHPLAGLGANLGLEDVAAFAERLPAAGDDPGAPGLWRSYARRRRARAQFMQRTLAGLQQIYAAPGPGAHWLRNLGVGLVQRTGPLRAQLIREALGLGPLARHR